MKYRYIVKFLVGQWGHVAYSYENDWMDNIESAFIVNAAMNAAKNAGVELGNSYSIVVQRYEARQAKFLSEFSNEEIQHEYHKRLRGVRGFCHASIDLGGGAMRMCLKPPAAHHKSDHSFQPE